MNPKSPIREAASIQWEYPPVRRGWPGLIDKIVDPGATSAEIWLTLLAMFCGGTGIAFYAVLAVTHWNLLHIVVITVIAADVLGGVVSNATSTSKRWWHRAGQGPGHHLSFAALHVYPFLVAWLFVGWSWLSAIIIYGYLLLATGIILAFPLYLQRAVALFLYCGVLILNMYLLQPPQGLEWLAPLLGLKLLVSHLLLEEPFWPLHLQKQPGSLHKQSH